MKVELTRQEILDSIKPLTSASTDDYAKTIKSMVYAFAKAVAFVYTLGMHLRGYIRQPRQLYLELAKLVETPAEVPSRGEERSSNNEQQAAAVTKTVKRTRTRKRSAKNANNTTPATA